MIEINTYTVYTRTRCFRMTCNNSHTSRKMRSKIRAHKIRCDFLLSLFIKRNAHLIAYISSFLQ